ncbi:MAG: SLC13 family permease [Parvularculaceae bacterium]|nr:SLC13 family permease [Parvularculaceae bacterium]
MWATLVIIAGTITAYASDRFSMELVSIATLVVMLMLFDLAPLTNAAGQQTLTTEALLSGFAEPALVAVMCLLVLGQGLFQAGTMETPTRYLLHALNRGGPIVIIAVFALVLLTSGFLNDTPVVVMFLPIIAALASEGGISASRLMMPLSFIALFGGMTTIIGSSTNILAAGVYKGVTGDTIGFFELTPMALVIAATGLVYLATAGRMLLPRRRAETSDDDSENRQFIAQFDVTRDHFLNGRKSVSGLFPDLPDVTVRMVNRHERTILPPFDDLTLSPGDIVIVAATRKTLTSLFKSNPDLAKDALAEIILDDEKSETRLGRLSIVEGIVTPGSRMVGQSIGQLSFHYKTNCTIIGIERRSRMLRRELRNIRLEAGDVLLILGAVDDVRALQPDRDFVLLTQSMTDIPPPGRALLAGVIFIGVVAGAAFGLASIAITASAGVFLMLATGCLNIRQAARAFDRRIFFLIGTSLAMGLALQETGGAALFGSLIAPIAGAFGAAALISIIFLISAVLTNVLSNNATAVLLTPIVVSAAEVAGISALPLVLTVIYGANCPFATPIAYQTNLLVMSPGHYRFSDFMRVGVPLIVLIWVVYSLVAPVYFSAVGKL